MLNRFLPNSGYYGWIVVGVAFLCSALTSPGQSFAISLYLDVLMADLAISRIQISSIYAGATLLAAACLPAVGGLADRVPGRWFLSVTLLLLGLSLLGFAMVEGVYGLAIAFLAVRLLGQGAIGLGTLTIVVRWFRTYRGRALALVSLGFALGEMVFPGAIYALIDRAGWRTSLVVFATLYLVVFAPLVAWSLRERRPGEPVDGIGAEQEATGAARRAAELDEPDFTLSETLRMRVFWGMLLCAIVPPLVMTAVIFHQVALFASLGWNAALVPPAFMAFALGGVVMTYTTGLLLERVPTRYGIALGMALIVVAFASTLLPLPVAVGGLLYGLLLGFASGTVAASNSMLWPSYFGIASLGRIKGIVQAARNGATALGPPLAALLATATASFTSVLLLFGGVSIAAGLLAITLRPPAGRPVGGAYEATPAEFAAD
ncbi:MAG: MFS transporter [Gemmatimonadota bacterium]